MFWDKVAFVYDLFANIYNKKVHLELQQHIERMICPSDVVLECACGTGMLSICIAPKCKKLLATDFSINMLKKAQEKCSAYPNAQFEQANILSLNFSDEQFNKVIAANVIHLLDEPYKALRELERVCRSGGQIIIPTYVSKEHKKKSSFLKIIGKAGANFKQQFSKAGYRDFFEKAGYTDVNYIFIDGRVPCAIAIITKKY